MIPKITRRSFAIGASAVAVTAVAGTLPAVAAVNSNAKKAYAYLYQKKAYAKHQAAGIVGNLMLESGVNPKSRQGGGGPGRGIAQWSVDGRWQSLLRYARNRQRDPYSLYLQLDFICYELDNYSYLGKKELKGTKSVDAATRVFCDRFERPGIPHMDRRLAYARELYKGGGGGGGGGGSQPPPGGFPTLRQGSRGSAVRSLQYLLTAHGYSLSPDGDFGSATNSRVRAFQSKKGLKDDGVVGPLTWGRVIISLKQGAKGAAVKALQAELNDAGHKLTLDGDFGPATNKAVLAYQSSKKLTVDGLVGAQTWGSLIN